MWELVEGRDGTENWELRSGQGDGVIHLRWCAWGVVVEGVGRSVRFGAPCMSVSLVGFVSRLVDVKSERKKSLMPGSGWSNWLEGGFLTE